jgi:hypothetical protein
MLDAGRCWLPFNNSSVGGSCGGIKRDTEGTRVGYANEVKEEFLHRFKADDLVDVRKPGDRREVTLSLKLPIIWKI